MSNLLARLARRLTHHWVRAGIVALLALIVVGALSANGKPAADDFSTPGTETQQAIDLLQKHNPALAGVDSDVVFTAKAGKKLTDPDAKAAVEKALVAIRKLDGVAIAASPYEGQGSLSPDGTIAQVSVRYDVDPSDVEKEDGLALIKAAETAEGDAVSVSERGVLIDFAAEQEFPVGELVGVGLAIILLTLLFRSGIAMFATLFGALVGVALGQMVLMILASPLGLPSFAAIIATMLGLGAGIDYALLIIGRFREQMAAGDSVRDASAKAMGTAGSAVVAAGLIVMVAIAGLLVIGLPFIGMMGVGAAIAVAAVVISSLTILPILIGAFKKRLRPKKYAHIAPSAAFGRWGEIVTAKPWLSVGAAVAVLLVLAFPVTQMRLGQPDDGNKATDQTQRVAYDQLSKAFGPGSNGPFLLAVDIPKGAASNEAQLETLRAAVDADRGVTVATPAAPSEDGEMATILAIPTTAPQDKETSDLLKRLRDDVVPAAVKGTDLKVYIGGNTAAVEDMSAKVTAGLPLFMSVVIGLSVLLLMAAFRSIWIPLVSAVLNLLSIGAAFGVITAVFQMGFGAELIGSGAETPIMSFVPVMMFAILFGLSMDYNVFLLSRVHEAYNEGDRPRESVIHGMSRIGKVILFAALIMASVFLAFVTQPDVVAKMFGVGLGLAVLIDVLIVRLVVAPALVTILGDKAWWFPEWLDKILPNVSLEGHLVENKDPRGPALGPDGWEADPSTAPEPELAKA